MIDPTLPDAERRTLVETGVDWRIGYASRQDGHLAVHPEELARELGTAAWVPRSLGTVAAAIEPLRAEPSHRSEQVSEILGGEWLQILDVCDDWAVVRGEDGYVGWVATWNLKRQSAQDRLEQLDRRLGHFGRVRGTLWLSDHWAHGPLWLGQPLLRPPEGLRERGTRWLVATAAGEEGWIPRADVVGEVPGADVDTVLRLGHQLLGTPYRWGGRSPAGLDCSGLTQLLWGRVGIGLPRDSSQQAAVGEAVGLDPKVWRRGDLLFFDDPATHVGVLEDPETLLHARGQVRRDRLDSLGPLLARLSGVRRVQAEPAATPTLWTPALAAPPA